MSKSMKLAGSLAFAFVAMAPATALARDTGMGDMAEELSNPKTQHAVAGMMEAMTEMLLSMKIAPMAKAMESMGGHGAMRDLPSNATLADVAGPDARRMPREVSRRVPQMMTAMAGMGEAMQAMLPQLEAMAAKIAEGMPADQAEDEAR